MTFARIVERLREGYRFRVKKHDDVVPKGFVIVKRWPRLVEIRNSVETYPVTYHRLVHLIRTRSIQRIKPKGVTSRRTTRLA